MDTEQSSVKPRTRGRKILVFMGWAALGLLGLHTAATWIWHYSGSNTWELAHQSDTVKVYTLKSPGSDRLLIKANYRAKASLSQIVAGFKDPKVCQLVGCLSGRLEHVNDNLEYYWLRLPRTFPFKPRDVMLRIVTIQHPVTREVLIEVAAVQDREPPNDCCVRIVDMNNIWKLKPAGNGMVDVEFIINADLGGYFPDILMNMTVPRVLTGISAFERLYNARRYRDAKFDYIVEPEDVPLASNDGTHGT
jgi:hypothetical protein